MKVEITQHPTWISFSENLKKLELRFPVAELSEKLGYTQSNVSIFIRGKKIPSGKFLEKFYETYGEEILKIDDEVERKRKEKYADMPVQFPICGNCLLKDKEIIELRGQVKLLREMLKDASDNNKSKALSA